MKPAHKERLRSAPSGKFLQQTAISRIRLVTELQSLKGACSQVVHRISEMKELGKQHVCETLLQT